MAKQGQHKNDAFDQTKSPGPNNPSKSQPITTGSVKKQETYAEQARQGEDPGKPGQQVSRRPEGRDRREDSPRTRARASDLTGGRSGSDSSDG
jgi:hypothetical protein